MTVEYRNDDWVAEQITARVTVTPENAADCPRLIGLSQILAIDDEHLRQERRRIYLRQYRSELIAELEAMGITFEWPTEAVDPTEPADDDEESYDPEVCGPSEIDVKERYAESNRRRAYINSTF